MRVGTRSPPRGRVARCLGRRSISRGAGSASSRWSSSGWSWSVPMLSSWGWSWWRLRSWWSSLSWFGLRRRRIGAHRGRRAPICADVGRDEREHRSVGWLREVCGEVPEVHVVALAVAEIEQRVEVHERVMEQVVRRSRAGDREVRRNSGVWMQAVGVPILSMYARQTCPLAVTWSPTVSAVLG